MEVTEAIATRRSIRKFKPGSIVDEEAVNEFLRAAMTGPSASNVRPWEFIVVRDRTSLDKIAKVRPYMKDILEHTAVMIVVVLNEERKKFEGRWIQNCSVSMQNILLAVHGMGYGGSWQQIYPEEKTIEGIIEILKLPEYVMPFGMVPIGESDEEKEDRETFEKERVHFEKW